MGRTTYLSVCVSSSYNEVIEKICLHPKIKTSSPHAKSSFSSYDDAELPHWNRLLLSVLLSPYLFPGSPTSQLVGLGSITQTTRGASINLLGNSRDLHVSQEEVW